MTDKKGIGDGTRPMPVPTRADPTTDEADENAFIGSERLAPSMQAPSQLFVEDPDVTLTREPRGPSGASPAAPSSQREGAPLRSSLGGSSLGGSSLGGSSTGAFAGPSFDDEVAARKVAARPAREQSRPAAIAPAKPAPVDVAFQPAPTTTPQPSSTSDVFSTKSKGGFVPPAPVLSSDGAAIRVDGNDHAEPDEPTQVAEPRPSARSALDELDELKRAADAARRAAEDNARSARAAQFSRSPTPAAQRANVPAPVSGTVNAPAPSSMTLQQSAPSMTQQATEQQQPAAKPAPSMPVFAQSARMSDEALRSLSDADTIPPSSSNSAIKAAQEAASPSQSSLPPQIPTPASTPMLDSLVSTSPKRNGVGEAPVANPEDAESVPTAPIPMMAGLKREQLRDDEPSLPRARMPVRDGGVDDPSTVNMAAAMPAPSANASMADVWKSASKIIEQKQPPQAPQPAPNAAQESAPDAFTAPTTAPTPQPAKSSSSPPWAAAAAAVAQQNARPAAPPPVPALAPTPPPPAALAATPALPPPRPAQESIALMASARTEPAATSSAAPRVDEAGAVQDTAQLPPAAFDLASAELAQARDGVEDFPVSALGNAVLSTEGVAAIERSAEGNPPDPAAFGSVTSATTAILPASALAAVGDGIEREASGAAAVAPQANMGDAPVDHTPLWVPNPSAVGAVIDVDSTDKLPDRQAREKIATDPTRVRPSPSQLSNPDITAPNPALPQPAPAERMSATTKVDDDDGIERPRSRGPLILAIAAVATVIIGGLVVVAIVLFGNGGAGATTTTTAPPATTTAPPATTTTAPPATTTAPPADTAPPATTTAAPPVDTAPPTTTTAAPPAETPPPVSAPPTVTETPPAVATAPPPPTTTTTEEAPPPATTPATTAPPVGASTRRDGAYGPFADRSGSGVSGLSAALGRGVKAALPASAVDGTTLQVKGEVRRVEFKKGAKPLAASAECGITLLDAGRPRAALSASGRAVDDGGGREKTARAAAEACGRALADDLRAAVDYAKGK